MDGGDTVDEVTELTLQSAVVAYLQDLATKRSENTVKTYAGRLRLLTDYLDGAAPLSTLTPDALVGFPSWLVRQQMAKSSRDTCLTAVEGFIAFLFRNGYVAMGASDYERVRYEFAETRKRRAEEKGLPPVPSRQAVEATIKAARAVPRPDPESRDADRYRLQRLRDIAVLELLRATGIRVGEVVSLMRGSLDYERKSVRVTVTKSKQGRSVPVDRRAWNAVQAYLTARDGEEVNGLRELPLFAGHARKSGREPRPLTTRTVQMRVRALAQAAGVEEELTPHSFRHRLATDLVRATQNLEATRKALGHESIATTQKYTHLVDEDVEKAMGKVATLSDSTPQPTLPGLE